MSFQKAVAHVSQILRAQPEFGGPARTSVHVVTLEREFDAPTIAAWTQSRLGYDLVVSQVAARLRRDARLSAAERDFAAEVLEGKTGRPKGRKRPPFNLTELIGYAVETARKHVRSTYRNEEKDQPPESAIDAVAVAATRCGKHMTYDQVRARYRTYTRRGHLK